MSPVRELPPANEVTNASYDLRTLQAPVLSGAALAVFVRLYESSLGGTIYGPISRDSGVHQVLHEISMPETPLFLPSTPVNELGEEPGCISLEGAPEQQVASLEQLWPSINSKAAPLGTDDIDISMTPATTAPADAPDQGAQPAGTSSQYRRPTVADYVAAYKSGQVTPNQVAERLIQAIKTAKAKGYGWFTQSSEQSIREQAQESTDRWARGEPLSCLDGVPYAIKDVIHAEPYQTTVGTAYAADKWPAQGNAPMVSTLGRLGAILLGKTTMHEIGLGVTGLNPRGGTALNPYNPRHHTGGSSSGNAGVLAAGLCPLTVGGDGGGSIRIPSAFCGAVGLKTTSGRVSSVGCFQDTALLYTVLANHDAWYTPMGEPLPIARVPRSLRTAEAKPLEGHTAGVYWEWFRDADPEVVAACTAAVALLELSGLKVNKIESIPELEYLRVGHNCTIVSEMLHCVQGCWEDPKTRALMSPDIRIGLNTATHWTPADYIQSQRIRARATTHFKRVFESAEVILTPTVPITAPVIPSGALKGGSSNLGLTSKIMRYAPAANMLGLPSISVPVGVDSKGLPIGLQIMGKPWHEATLLKLGAQLEQALQTKAQSSGSLAPVAGTPQIWIDPLTGHSNGLA